MFSISKAWLGLSIFIACAGMARAADTISSTTIRNTGMGGFMGSYAFLFGNASDGTGESAVLKVSSATLAGTPTELKITRMKWSTNGMAVSVLFDATTDSRVAVLSGNGEFDESKDGGPLKDPRAAGATGNVLFTTHISTDTPRPSYTIFMELKKVN